MSESRKTFANHVAVTAATLVRTEIPVTVVDIASIARGELAENFHRKDFLPSEIEAIRRTLEPIEKAAAKWARSEADRWWQLSTSGQG
jgi:ParB-like chromosome segregation protein Spo0J